MNEKGEEKLVCKQLDMMEVRDREKERKRERERVRELKSLQLNALYSLQVFRLLLILCYLLNTHPMDSLHLSACSLLFATVLSI